MREYRLVDYLTQGYIGVVALLILLFHNGDLPLWPAYVAAHIAGMVAVHFVVRLGSRRERGPLHLLRCFYPIILYSLFYTETHDLDSLICPTYLDPFFIGLEQSLLGCQPSRLLMQRLPYLAISEPLHMAYFSYYTMVLGVGLWLYVKRRARLFHYLTVVSFVFYVCYLIYICLPVMGPHGNWVETAPEVVRQLIGSRRVPDSIRSGPFFLIMQQVYRLVEPRGGAAFPSSHVAVAITTNYFTFLYWRKVRWVHLVAVILLCVSTVYCGYHYVVDVIAGVLTAALLVLLGNWLYGQTGEWARDNAADGTSNGGGEMPNTVSSAD